MFIIYMEKIIIKKVIKSKKKRNEQWIKVIPKQNFKHRKKLKLTESKKNVKKDSKNLRVVWGGKIKLKFKFFYNIYLKIN